MDHIRKSGSHSWDIIVQYHRCPKCGFIQESREDYQYRLGKYMKDLDCTRCHHHFSIIKRARPSFGPFFGP